MQETPPVQPANPYPPVKPKPEQSAGSRPSKTIKLSGLTSAPAPVQDQFNAPVAPEKKTENKVFTPDELKVAWLNFAETRKIYQAEYQLLQQPVELQGTKVILQFHNPVQETLLNSLRSDITAYLREELGNSSIQVTGELKTPDDKPLLYTNREKFEHLVKKNPVLQELKEKLGLDTDF